MACEKKDVHDMPSVVCTVPPHPDKDHRAFLTDTRVRVLGIVLVTAFIMAGFLGVVYVMSSPRTEQSYSSNDSSESYLKERKEATVEFSYQEELHTEVVTVEGDREVVTVTDIEDDFIVTLDYKRGIAVVKNTSSSQCFFTRLENFPEFQTKDMDNLRPILVEEVHEMPGTPHTQETVHLQRSDIIPWEYVQVTSDPSIAGQCIDATSYWLQVSPTHSVQRRDEDCGCVILIIIIIIIVF